MDLIVVVVHTINVMLDVVLNIHVTKLYKKPV
jgi:hypothetical protein